VVERLLGLRELVMQRKFKPSTRADRAIFVAIALVLTVAVHAAVFGLAGHYDREYLRVAQARARAAVVAERGKAAEGQGGRT
jgi:hypothetical protein